MSDFLEFPDLRGGSEPPAPLEGGVSIAEGVRLAYGPPHPETWDGVEVTFRTFKIYRRDDQGASGEMEIGSGDYLACHACRQVQLGEIGFFDWEQRRGFGTRVMEQLRAEVPGYRWCLTPMKTPSEPFWQRLQHTHPGEYYDARDPWGWPCPHLVAAR